MTVGKAEADGADGFFGATAIRAGDARNAEGVVGIRRPPCPRRHFVYHGFADCAVLPQAVGGNAQQTLFRFVAVGNEACFKPGGAAGQAGEFRRQQAAGAGFGATDGKTSGGEAGGQQMEDGVGCRVWHHGFSLVVFLLCRNGVRLCGSGAFRRPVCR